MVLKLLFHTANELMDVSMPQTMSVYAVDFSSSFKLIFSFDNSYIASEIQRIAANIQARVLTEGRKPPAESRLICLTRSTKIVPYISSKLA